MFKLTSANWRLPVNMCSSVLITFGLVDEIQKKTLFSCWHHFFPHYITASFILVGSGELSRIVDNHTFYLRDEDCVTSAVEGAFQVICFLEKVTQRSPICTRQTKEKKHKKTCRYFLQCAVCVGGGGPTQEWESTCLYQAFRHTTLAAKIHRSLYIKFLQLTWHTAVNQSMKGKLICCSLSLFVSLRLLFPQF